jgi:hypothetical protein
MAVRISRCAEYELLKREWCPLQQCVRQPRLTSLNCGEHKPHNPNMHNESNRACEGASKKATHHNDQAFSTGLQLKCLQTHTQTTTRRQSQLQHLWSRSKHNRPHQTSGHLHQPERCKHNRQLPSPMQTLQLTPRRTIRQCKNQRPHRVFRSFG